MYYLSVYRTHFTNYLTCSFNSPILVSTEVLGLLMGVERVNDLFGGPRLQTGRAGTNPGLLILNIQSNFSKAFFLSRLFHPPTFSHSFLSKSVFRGSSERFRGKRSWVIRESLVDFCFLQAVLALVTQTSSWEF